MKASMIFLLAAWPVLAPADATVTYLASEAYLIDDGEHAVLIDAFVPDAYKIYEPLAPADWTKMRDGAPPFDRVTAAVVTHHHRDHFQADAAAAYLNAHPGVTLFGPPAVIDALRTAGYKGERAVSALPGYGKRESHDLDGVTLSLLRLRHMPAGDTDIEHLGVLLDIGGHRVLHLGDAYPDEENFRPHELPHDELDLAIVPDWFFATQWFPEAPALVNEFIAPACMLATHVAIENRAATLKRLAAEFPALMLLAERGASLDISSCAE